MKFKTLAFSLLAMVPFADADTTKVAFGSCADQDNPQPIWNTIVKDQPDIFLFLGDNVYADTEDRSEMEEAYAGLGAKSGFQALRQSTEIMAVWDDHDLGANDGGGDFPAKHMAREVFADFWQHGPDSPVRHQEGGVYQSRILGEPGKRVQVILLDTRWNRSPLVKAPKFINENVNKVNRIGPYWPTDDTSATLIGEAQWQWLEEQLKQPAEVRIIASSIQIVAEFSGWETWANFPHERQRLFDLINHTQANGVVLISGDIHKGEVSRLENVVGYPLWEITSSGLATHMYPAGVNQHRLQPSLIAPHYATIEVDWSEQLLHFSLKGLYGNVPQHYQVPLSRLSHLAQ